MARSWLLASCAALALLAPAWADGLSAPIAVGPIGQSSAAVRFPPQSSGGAGCPTSATFLARTSGLSGTQISAYQIMICGMVTDGTWSLMDGLWVFATNTTTTANLNLVSTSFSLTVHGTETFAADAGYTGDGSTGYFDTGYNTSTSGVNYTQNSASLGECTLTSRTAQQSYNAIGNQETVNFFANLIAPLLSAGGPLEFELTGNTYLQDTPSPFSAQGSYIETRTTSSTVALYLNGTSAFSGSDTSGALANANIFIGALNEGGTAGLFDADQLAYAFIGGGLTGTQISNIYSRLHTFLVAVGAPSGC